MTLKLKNTSAPATGLPINNRSRTVDPKSPKSPDSFNNRDDSSSDEDEAGEAVY